MVCFIVEGLEFNGVIDWDTLIVYCDSLGSADFVLL